MMRSVAFAATLLATLLSGCASDDPATGPSASEPTFDDLDLQATSSTGLIRGVVVDDAIRPIGGATIRLNGDQPRETESSSSGTFGFEGLTPGTYFLEVSKVGYFKAQQSTDVIAGVAEPPIVKVLLAVDVANLPFTEVLQWAAFLQCGGAIPQVGSLNPCAVADSDNVHDFTFGGNRTPDFAQVEAVWEGTQPLGNYLSMGFYDPESLASDWKGVDGSSVLILTANKTEIQDALGEDADHTTVRLFPGTGPDGMNPTVVANQRYDIFVTYFYGFLPKEGWSIAVDGPCSTPEQCGT